MSSLHIKIDKKVLRQKRKSATTSLSMTNFSLNENISYATEKLDQVKGELIRVKLNFLYGFISEEQAVDKFTEMKKLVNLWEQKLFHYQKQLHFWETNEQELFTLQTRRDDMDKLLIHLKKITNTPIDMKFTLQDKSKCMFNLNKEIKNIAQEIRRRTYKYSALEYEGEVVGKYEYDCYEKEGLVNDELLLGKLGTSAATKKVASVAKTLSAAATPSIKEASATLPPPPSAASSPSTSASSLPSSTSASSLPSSTSASSLPSSTSASSASASPISILGSCNVPSMYQKIDDSKCRIAGKYSEVNYINTTLTLIQKPYY